MKKIYLLFLFVLSIAFANAQLTGTKNIPGDYPTLAAAITDLNTQGVGAGGVTINLNQLETVPAGGYVIGDVGSLVLATASSSNPIIIAGNGNTVTSSTALTPGSLTDAIFKLIGSDWVTITGFTMREDVANTTTAAATNNMTEFGVALFYATPTDGVQNCTILNNSIVLNKTYTNTFGIYSSTRHTASVIGTAAEATSATGSNSNNKFYGNTITNVNIGIVLIGSAATPAVLDNNNDVGGNSALTGNNITGFGTGATASAYLNVGTSVYGVLATGQVGDNISNNTVTSSAMATSSTVFGVIRAFLSGQPTGLTFTSNMNNNTVTLTNNPTAATTGALSPINNQGITPLVSTATLNMTGNVVTGCNIGGSVSTTVGYSCISNASLAGLVNMNNNRITNNTITATTATSGVINGLSNSAAAGTVNMTGNVIRGYSTTATSGQIQGVTNSGAVVTALNITNNNFGDATTNFVTYPNATSGALFGIATSGAGAACSTLIQGNDIRRIVNTVAGTNANTYISSTGVALNCTVNNNTFTNLAVNSTGGITFISMTYSALSAATKTVSNNNIVTAFNKSGGGGTVNFIIDNGSTSAGAVSNCINNNFSNVTLTGATTLTGISYTDGGTAPTRTVSGNIINNITAGTSAVNAMNFTYWSGNSSLTNNTVTNITGQGAITGITIGNAVGTATSVNISSNTINNLSSTGAGGTVIGLSCLNVSPSVTIGSNVINTLSSTGASAVSGISVSGATATTVSKNKIYNLSGSNASSTVNGVIVSAGSLVNVQNNIIGDLRTPVANAANPLIGINVTGGTTVNAYYNTVSLSGTSSGALFGSSALSASTTPALTLRNNIFVNTSAVTGTGLTVAYRRSTTTLPSYGSASNNNDFFAGTPGAGNLIFYDGTNSDQTITSYKTRVASRDAQSFSESPVFVSTIGASSTFLHINTSTPTQIESGGSAIAGITDDFDGDIRNVSTPDVGADEFTGAALDLTAPTITYTPLPNTTVGANQTLTATITDASGVPTSGIGLPVLYYKVNSGSYVAVTGTFIGSNQYTFTFGGATTTVGDIVSYYIVAQDGAATPNVGASPSAGAGGFTINPPAAGTPPTTPSTFTATASISGTINVGSAETYTSLTNPGGIFALINGATVTGNVTVNITSDLTGETGAISLNQFASPYTVTIIPSGAARNITGTLASAALIKLNGADRVIFDGSIGGGGTDRSLTITNSNTTAPGVIGIISLGVGAGATDNTIKNCNLTTGIETSIGYGVSIGGSTPGTAGADNDNTTIQNNSITAAAIGVYANGTASVSTGGNDNLTIRGNVIDYNSTLASIAIQAANSLNSIISGNAITEETTATQAPTGISVETGFVSSVISKNNISKSLTTNTGGYGGRGITVSTGTAASNLTIANNFISGVNGSNWSSFGVSSSMGIAIGALNGTSTITNIAGGINIYYNSITMTGSMGSGSATAITTALYIGSGASAMDVRDNIFSNTQVATSNTQKNYAIYSAAASSAFSNIDYNDYYVSNSFNAGSAILGNIGGTDRTTIPALQTGFGGNTNAQNGAPAFTSASNLHLLTPNTVNFNTLESKGIVVSVTDDIDGQSRPNGTAPDLGADEFIGVAPTCPGATGVSVGSITTTSASVTFAGSGTFILEYGLSGFTPGAGNTAGVGGTLVNPAVSPQSLTGLAGGTTYDVYIRQDCTSSLLGYSPNSSVLSFTTLVPPPANDDCINAIAIPCGGSRSGNNSAATNDALPAVTCGSTTSTIGNNKGVWYTVTPSLGGSVTVATCTSSFDTYLRVYDGSCGAFTACMGFDDDGCSSQSTVTFTAVGGTTYYVLLGGYGSTDFGNYTISATCPAACPAPSAVAVNTITSTSANVTWTGSGTSILEYGITGFTPGTGATAGAGGTVINPATSPQALSGLTPSTTYQVYVRQDCTLGVGGYSTNSPVVSFTTLAIPPVNDEAPGALLLSVNAGCTGAPYTNVAATASATEPFPSCSGTKSAPVWFKFVAPLSGAVRISTDFAGGGFTDSKVGLFSATDVNDYSTFNIISCDDDGGSVVGSGFLSVVYATGLRAGDTYYVAVDKYSTGTTAGTFCVAVDELSNTMLSTTNTCGSTYQGISSNGATGYTGWLSLLDASSKIVALVRNPTGMNPQDFTTFQQNINTGAVRQTGGVYYLDRNFRISSTETNVDVQFFFLNTELAALTAMDPGATLPNLGGAKQVDGGVCQNNFVTTNGAFTSFNQSGNGTINGVNWITTTVPSFSNFYLFKASAVVPVTIEYFRGSKLAAANYLNWKVTCTSAPSVTLVLERSSDGRTFKSIEEQNATATRCLQDFSYTDNSPLSGMNYYRLKIITPDGASRYSTIVALLNKDKGFEFVNIAPNPVKNTAVLTLTTVKGGKMDISVTDVAGKVVMKQSVTVIGGSNAITMDFGSIGAGTYQITGMTADGEIKTTRFVKL